MATQTVSKFDYQVRDRGGKLVTGQLEAENHEAVAKKLSSMGYAPVKISQVKDSGLNKELSIPGFDRVKLKDLAIFSRQFSTMINSGLSLIRALSILAEQTESKKLASTLDVVRTDVEGGRSLSEAMAEHPKVFSNLYVSMVRAGEAAGMLDQVLLRVAEMYEKDVELRSKIKSAMTYPIIVFLLAIILTTVMLIFIVPVFAQMFEDLGGELPLLTRWLVAASNFVMSWWGVVTYIVVPVGLWFTYKTVRANPNGRYALDAAKLKMPVFGPLFQKIALSRFARNLSTLLAAGVPILQALEITSDTVNNGVMGSAIQDVKGSIRSGELRWSSRSTSRSS